MVNQNTFDDVTQGNVVMHIQAIILLICIRVVIVYILNVLV